MTSRNYEAMFLLDNRAAQADWDEVSGKVDAILDKHGATIVKKEKWDERKLAYEIKGQRRATYYLVYFQSSPSAINTIREDVQLTEVILRHMVLALDEEIDVHIKKRDEERELLAEDSRRHALSGWGGGGGRRRRDRRSERPRDGERSGDAKPGDAGGAATATAAPAAEKPATDAGAGEKNDSGEGA